MRDHILTFRERKIIEEWNGRISQREIAKRINFSSSSINHEIKKNEKPYNAEKAQKRSEDVMIKKMSDMSRKTKRHQLKHNHPNLFDEKNKSKEIQKHEIHDKKQQDCPLETRLRNIEFQIEIILDTLKELQR